MPLAHAILTDCNNVLTNYEKNATPSTFQSANLLKSGEICVLS